MHYSGQNLYQFAQAVEARHSNLFLYPYARGDMYSNAHPHHGNSGTLPRKTRCLHAASGAGGNHALPLAILCHSFANFLDRGLVCWLKCGTWILVLRSLTMPSVSEVFEKWDYAVICESILWLVISPSKTWKPNWSKGRSSIHFRRSCYLRNRIGSPG